MSGVSQIGSRPARTKALKTERCAVRESATLSPGLPSAKMIAWFAWVEPPVENRAQSAFHNVAARASALRKT
ncbi:unannotated protein [freshwater metagenome]|uniref:Unannotated protein n=1 Tax=freshwater metagenome TaxID=449393 RepID=A0A6J7TNL4_9ZZZZ